MQRLYPDTSRARPGAPRTAATGRRASRRNILGARRRVPAKARDNPPLPAQRSGPGADARAPRGSRCRGPDSRSAGRARPPRAAAALPTRSVPGQALPPPGRERGRDGRRRCRRAARGSAAERARPGGCTAPAPAARGTREQRCFVTAAGAGRLPGSRPRGSRPSSPPAARWDRESAARVPRGLVRGPDALGASGGERCPLPAERRMRARGGAGPGQPRVPARRLERSAPLRSARRAPAAGLGAAHARHWLISLLPGPSTRVSCGTVHPSRQTTSTLNF